MRKSRAGSSLTMPPGIPGVDPRRPATALAALDEIATRCKRMSITFTGVPPARMQASIEAGDQFPLHNYCASVTARGVNVRTFANTIRHACQIIRRVPRFRIDPDTLGAQVSRGLVDPRTFRELARLALIAGFGVKPTATDGKAAKSADGTDPIATLEQAFGRAKRMYVTTSWFNIHSSPLYGGGKSYSGTIWPTNRTFEAATFGDAIAQLTALTRKPMVTVPASIKVLAPGSGVSAKRFNELVLAMLARVLGPRHVVRASTTRP